jgi:hypothetical protein
VLESGSERYVVAKTEYGTFALVAQFLSSDEGEPFVRKSAKAEARFFAAQLE